MSHLDLRDQHAYRMAQSLRGSAQPSLGSARTESSLEAVCSVTSSWMVRGAVGLLIQEMASADDTHLFGPSHFLDLMTPSACYVRYSAPESSRN